MWCGGGGKTEGREGLLCPPQPCQETAYSECSASGNRFGGTVWRNPCPTVVSVMDYYNQPPQPDSETVVGWGRVGGRKYGYKFKCKYI